jgi:hypothetical protein
LQPARSRRSAPKAGSPTINPAGLDGLHDVTVTVEQAKTHKPICELQTLLFEAPDSPTTEEPPNKKSPAARRKRGRG